MKDFDGPRGDKHRGGGHKGRKHHHHGAQTFRRGRALEFLERLTVKRDTLKQQFEAPEFQEIKLTILGELKALDLVIEEYTRHFELYQICEPDQQDQQDQEEGQS